MIHIGMAGGRTGWIEGREERRPDGAREQVRSTVTSRHTVLNVDLANAKEAGLSSEGRVPATPTTLNKESLIAESRASIPHLMHKLAYLENDALRQASLMVIQYVNNVCL